MSIDEQELRAIQFLAERVRKATPGATAWDTPGLTTNLRKLQNRNLHMTIEHVLRHAADPKAKSPGVLLGSFTPEAPTGVGRPYPPKKREECVRHPGWWADNCGGCHVDMLAKDESPSPRPKPGDATAGAAAVRAAIREVGA